jgi:3-oxoacyl-[acyl-carrier-protein] synthase II
MRRVVITGVGLVTPLGWGTEVSWKNLLAGKSGCGRITAFDPEGYGCEIACEVPRVDGRGGGGPDVEGSFDPDQVMSARDQRRVDDFILYAMAAADEAVKDSGFAPDPETEEGRRELERAGVMLGSGIGGLSTIADQAVEMEEKGPRRVSPFFIPSALINLASGQVSIRYGFKGPNHAVVTACATGAHAIGDAARLIAFGDADVMLAGGGEAAVCKIGVAGFVAARAMSTGFNDNPEKASRPYDKDRDGFVMGEGAGTLMLEEYEHAMARGAKIYAEVAGYGLAGDAYHITAPHESGDGGFRAMQAAIGHAGIQPSDIDYINAHGTSTPLGDEIELRAVERMLGDAAARTTMSSTKGATGHLLGAAGAIEAAFSALAIRDQIAPPTINLDNPSVETPIDLVPHKAKPMKIDVVLSNSFGFGGTNASLVLKKVP